MNCLIEWEAWPAVENRFHTWTISNFLIQAFPNIFEFLHNISCKRPAVSPILQCSSVLRVVKFESSNNRYLCNTIANNVLNKVPQVENHFSFTFHIQSILPGMADICGLMPAQSTIEFNIHHSVRFKFSRWWLLIIESIQRKWNFSVGLLFFNSFRNTSAH